jgi:hypothetical protein
VSINSGKSRSPRIFLRGFSRFRIPKFLEFILRINFPDGKLLHNSAAFRVFRAAPERRNDQFINAGFSVWRKQFLFGFYPGFFCSFSISTDAA